MSKIQGLGGSRDPVATSRTRGGFTHGPLKITRSARPQGLLTRSLMSLCNKPLVKRNIAEETVKSHTVCASPKLSGGQRMILAWFSPAQAA
jgi:hypothetical protein